MKSQRSDAEKGEMNEEVKLKSLGLSGKIIETLEVTLLFNIYKNGFHYHRNV